MSKNQEAAVDDDGTLATAAIDDAELDRLTELLGLENGHAASLTAFDRLADDDLATKLFDGQDDDPVASAIEASSLSADDVRDPLAQVVEGTARPLDGDYFSQSAELGERLAGSDLELAAYFGAVSQLFDAMVATLAERAPTEADGADDEATVDLQTFARQVGSLHRLVQANQLVAIETRSDVRESDVAAERDELEATVERQQLIAKQVSAAVDATEAANQNVNDLAAEIDEQTDRQARDIETIAGESSELTASIEEVASMAQEAARTSEQATEAAEAGQRSGETAIEKMDAVETAAENAVSDLDALQERVAEIDQFVEVINEVADDTNMLALNASIEAARAGDSGQGFAVVADEVKNLASESREEAGKIEELVDDIHVDTAETKASLSTTMNRIEETATEVETATTKLEEITESVQETLSAIEEVSDASDEQAGSAEEIASMMDELDEMAQSISENASEITAGMEDQLQNVEMIASSVDQITE